MFSWGHGTNGQLGDGTSGTNKSSPVQIGSNSWIAVDAGGPYRGYHSAAIRSDGGLFTWGLNNRGQLGDGTIVNKSSPVQIGSSSWTAVAAGSYHNLAIRSDGGLFAWGYSGTRGVIGDGTTTNRSSPVQVG